MSRIFISYRRDDSQDVVGRIYDRLVARYGEKAVYKDVDDIPLGVDFRDHIAGAVGGCAVCLVIIGPQWLTATDEQSQRRLDSEDDFVRLEIEAALARSIPVVPVLIGGAAMPRKADVPESLWPLLYRHATGVRPDPDFHRDVDRLIRGLGPHLRPGCTAVGKTLRQWWQKGQASSATRPEQPAKKPPRPRPPMWGRLRETAWPFLTPWRYNWKIRPWTVRDVVIVGIVAGIAALGAMMMLAAGTRGPEPVSSGVAGEYYEQGAAWHRQAIAYEQVGMRDNMLGSYGRAAAAYREAIHIEFRNGDCHWNLAICLEKIGDLEQAQWHWDFCAKYLGWPRGRPGLGIPPDFEQDPITWLPPAGAPTTGG